jgi:hypothetical protein
MPYVPDLSTVVRVCAFGSTALVLGWGVWELVTRLRKPTPVSADDKPAPKRPRRPTGRQWWG